MVNRGRLKPLFSVTAVTETTLAYFHENWHRNWGCILGHSWNHNYSV